MQRRLTGLATLFLCVALCVPSAHGTEVAITRVAAFQKIWESIRRPIEPIRSTPFSDLPESDAGMIIRFANYRGIIDDAEKFYPEYPLTLDDALVWLLRTRNVAHPDEVTLESLPSFLEKYPMLHGTDFSLAGLTATLTEDDLMGIMRRFDQLLIEEVHNTTNYGAELHGNGTASGEPFDMYAMTTAHKYLPFNTLLKVTNVATGLSVIVRVNDRGPFVAGRDLDLSAASFQKIGGKSGIIQTTIERLGDVSIVGDQRYCSGTAAFPMQRRITRDVLLTPGLPQILPLGHNLIFSSTRDFVVRAVIYPDGNRKRLQDWVTVGETFSFTPAVEGVYAFQLGTKAGRSRWMEMRVVSC